MASHDAAIRDAFAELMSESCLAQYPELADFYCMGCNPKQPLFTTTKNDKRKVRVCQTFANTIWDPSETSTAVKKYDHCGVNIGQADDPQIPGRHQSTWNQTWFLNLVRPPFFKDYEVEIVPDGYEDGCMSGAGRALASTALAVALAAVSMLASWEL